MTLAAALDRLVERIERFEALDKVNDAVIGALGKILRPGKIEDTLSGTPVGHPVHPLLVAMPIGAWTSAAVLDAMRADAKTTQQLIGIGALTAVPAAVTGASDWLTTSGAERRVGAAHALANYGGLALQAASWQARRNGHHGRGKVLSLAGLTLVGVAGWLGGHLAYALGVGVDTTAFQGLPSEWTDAVEVSAIGTEPISREVAGVPVLFFRSDNQVVAMADRCTHRGGPLHEGPLRDGCIVCPWHGSEFDRSGVVRSGPATRPQPLCEVRVVDGRVQIKRDEARTLRTNPVGH